MRDFVGIEKFAEIRGVSIEYARQLVREGKAPRHYRMGRRIMFKEEDIILWVENHVKNPENR